MNVVPTSDDVLACKSVLLELSVLFDAFWSKCVLIGGWVPYFILRRTARPGGSVDHVGSYDLDLLIDVDVIGLDGYTAAAEVMGVRGYRPGDTVFERIRTVAPPVVERPVDVRVHLLASEEAERDGSARRRMRGGLQLQIVPKASIAFACFFPFLLEGPLPDGTQHRAQVRVADEVACFAMKGAILPRTDRYGDKIKDGYDLFMLLRDYAGGPAALAARLREFRDEDLVKEAIENVRFHFGERGRTGFEWTVRCLDGFHGSQSVQEVDEIRNEVAYVFDRFFRALGGE